VTPLRYIFACSLGCCGLVVLGCHGQQKAADAGDAGASVPAAATTQPYSSAYVPPGPDPRKTAQWTERPVGIAQASTPVAQGPAPLVHLFDIGCPIRVVDADTHQVIATATVPARAIVSVDDRRGITVGRDNVLPGPLPAGHQYVIYAEPTTPGVIRQGVGPPAPLKQ
jgi:hypothetical protein